MIDTQKITDDPHGRFWRYGQFYVRHHPGDGEHGGKTHEVGWQWSLLRKGSIGFKLSTSDWGDDTAEGHVSGSSSPTTGPEGSARSPSNSPQESDQ